MAGSLLVSVDSRLNVFWTRNDSHHEVHAMPQLQVKEQACLLNTLLKHPTESEVKKIQPFFPDLEVKRSE